MLESGLVRWVSRVDLLLLLLPVLVFSSYTKVGDKGVCQVDSKMVRLWIPQVVDEREVEWINYRQVIRRRSAYRRSSSSWPGSQPSYQRLDYCNCQWHSSQIDYRTLHPTPSSLLPSQLLIHCTILLVPVRQGPIPASASITCCLHVAESYQLRY